MILKKKLLTAFALAAIVFTFAALPVNANDKEYDAVVRHLKTKYKAKKVKIPFMWLARAAVKVARPAGVKSFNLTVFEHLNFSRATLDAEMQSALPKFFQRRLVSDFPCPFAQRRAGIYVYARSRKQPKNYAGDD